MATGIITKTCTKCKTEKSTDEFHKDKKTKDGLRRVCKECVSAVSRDWREENKERHAANAKDWYEKNRGRILETKKAWRENNKEQFLEKHRAYYDKNKERQSAHSRDWYYKNKGRALETKKAYQKKRRATDPKFAFCLSIRNRLNQALGSGSGSGVKDLGCSVEWAIEYLESQFEEGWTWENRSKVWQIDHMFPLSAVDPTDRAQVKAVCNWRNLQPLSIRENAAKKDKIYPEHQKLFDHLVSKFQKKLGVLS